MGQNSALQHHTHAHSLSHISERESLERLWDIWSIWRVLNRSGLHSLGRHGQPSATALLIFQKWDTYLAVHSQTFHLFIYLLIISEKLSKLFITNKQVIPMSYMAPPNMTACFSVGEKHKITAISSQ